MRVFMSKSVNEIGVRKRGWSERCVYEEVKSRCVREWGS